MAKKDSLEPGRWTTVPERMKLIFVRLHPTDHIDTFTLTQPTQGDIKAQA